MSASHADKESICKPRNYIRSLFVWISFFGLASGIFPYIANLLAPAAGHELAAALMVCTGVLVILFWIADAFNDFAKRLSAIEESLHQEKG